MLSAVPPFPANKGGNNRKSSLRKVIIGSSTFLLLACILTWVYLRFLRCFLSQSPSSKSRSSIMDLEMWFISIYMQVSSLFLPFVSSSSSTSRVTKPHIFLKHFLRLYCLVIRVPGYRTEMCCVSCEVRTEFIYVMYKKVDRLYSLVISVPGYRSRGPGSIPGTTRKKK
jgi:hypothetical protein